LSAAIVQPSSSSTRVTPAPAATIVVAARQAENDGLLGDPLQAQRQLRDHPERPFGADQKPEQVVAG